MPSDSSKDPGLDESGRLAALAATGLAAVGTEVMDRLAALTARVLGAEVALVSLVDDACQFFPGQYGLGEPWSQTRTTSLDQSLCRYVVTSGEVVQIDDSAQDPRAVGAREALGLGAYLGAPLRDADGRVLGSLCVISGTPRCWSDDTRENLVDLAFGASSELQARIATTEARRARLDAERTARRLGLVAEASVVLSGTLDPELTSSRLLRVVVPSLATWAVMYLRRDDGYPQHIVARHEDEDRQDDLERLLKNYGATELLDRTKLRRVVRDGEPALVALDQTDVVVRPSDVGGLLRHLGTGDMLVVPMVVRHSVLGVLALVLDRTRGGYDDSDMALVTDLARRCALALDNARRYDRERQTAVALQQGLLSELPDIVGLDTCAQYEPASRHAEVGGDWYDLVEVDDDTAVAVIGDVTGHSITAAAVMGKIGGAIRSYALEGHSPSAILDQVDRTSGHLLGGLFATCTVVRLQRCGSGWRAECANAGHPPPLVVQPDGSQSFVEVHADPLVGLPGRSAPRGTTTFTVPAGATLVVYTDGLVERRGEPLADGLDRLAAAAGALATEPVGKLCVHLLRELAPDLRDDIALLAMRAG